MSILHKLLKYLLISAFSTLFLGLGQLGQLMSSNYDIRKHALGVWAGDSQDRQERVAEFTHVCLVGNKVKKEDFKKAMKTQEKEGIPEPLVKVCAEKNNHTELYNVINEADSILQTAAWPLSLL